MDRPPRQTYQIFSLPFQLNFYDVTPSFFGPTGNFLPHFVHVAPFIFITAGLIDCGKKDLQYFCSG